MIRIKSFTFNAFSENTYVLSDTTGACIVIDPGCYSEVERQQLKDYISAEGLKVEKVVNTHCHIDHVLGNAFVKATFQAPLCIPELEEPVLRAVPTYAQPWGFAAYNDAQPDELLPNNGQLIFGESALEILFVPGHSPGHLAFYHAGQGFCINGDALFYGSIGRTDLPGGNHAQLLNSIRTQLFTLPDETVIYCGHGPNTTIGFERQNNPFVGIGA